MNIAFRRFSSPWELLCSCKKETVFTAASGGVCWLKSGRGESGPQAGEALLGFSSQVCFTFWSHLAPRCWNWSHSEHWAHFLSLSIRENHLPACYHEEEAQGSAVIGLAGVTRHPQTSDCCSCLHGLPQPHTRGLKLKNCISHSFGGQMSKVRVLAESVPPGAALWLCPQVALLLCVHLLLSLKTSVLLGQAPTLRPHLTLVTTLKAPSPNILMLGIRASMYSFWRGHILANNDWLWIQGEMGDEAFPPKEGKHSPGGQNRHVCCSCLL